MRLLLTIAPAFLALAACEPQATVEAGPPEAAMPEPATTTLGGVDLAGPVNLLGTEPFWGVELSDGAIEYNDMEGREQIAPRPAPEMAGTTATWTTRSADGVEMVLTVMETTCSDGMSDRTYPLTARVEIGDTTLNGCGASSDFLRQTDETGAPREEAPPAG